MFKANQSHGQVATEYGGLINPPIALFLISVLALFLELLLIRWIGTEINIFAYLQNAVLVVCFMALGLGCLTSRQPVVIRKLLIPLFILVLLLAIPTTRELLGKISLLLSTLGDPIGWYTIIAHDFWRTFLSVSSGLLVMFILMLFIWEVFVPVGRILGRLMDEHPKPIWAYSVNIAGSLLGIWVFVLLSVFYQPPFAWFLVVGVLLFFFIGTPSSGRGVDFVLLFGIVVLAWFAGHHVNSVRVLWSPYQKLTISETGSRLVPYSITVNNTGYQVIVDANAESVPLDPERFSEDIRDVRQYDIPLLAHSEPQTVLVVGAGTGNDVAGALRHSSVKEITAVEIDPAIIYLGRRYHPEKPYNSTNVKVVIDDARSYFATSKDRYDVIIFGYLDAHTMPSMTNARLDHYVYTKEGIEGAKTLLRKGGVLFIKFVALKHYIADRIARLLREAFGEDPMIFRMSNSTYAPGPTLFMAGELEMVRKRIASNNILHSWTAKWEDNEPLSLAYTTEVTTDNWPYLNLRSRHIPLLYYLLALMIIALFLYTKWRFELTGLMSSWTRTHWHFFFLGAAFLLLEVQNISKAAVVFGNTWWVNAVIISGILVMILTANLVVAQFPDFPTGLVYAGLIGSCMALYFVDLARFGFLPYYQKVVIVGMLTALPVFFSGLVFIRSFAGVISRDTALGANLIGSLVGGLLQSVTFITGIKALLLIVAAIYLAAVLCRPRREDAVQHSVICSDN